MRRLRLATRLFAAAMLVLASPVVSAAAPIDPGFDLFETRRGTQATLAPFGLVTFKGVPFDPVNNLGTTDTIVQRTGSLPDGGTGPIPIELVALHLVSVAPIVVAPFGPVDVHVTINKGGIIAGLPQPDALFPSLGTLTVQTHDDAPGGTFDSVLHVFGDVILTSPGGNPNNPLVSQASDEGDVVANAIVWSHVAPPGYPANPSFSPGGFFPPLPFDESGTIAIHSIGPPRTPPVPLPAPLTLVALGSLIVIGVARRKQGR